MAINDLNQIYEDLRKLQELQKDDLVTSTDYKKLITEWEQARKEKDKYRYGIEDSWKQRYPSDSMDQWRREKERDIQYREYIAQIEEDLKEMEYLIEVSLNKMAESGFLTFILLKDPEYAQLLERFGFNMPKRKTDQSSE